MLNYEKVKKEYEIIQLLLDKNNKQLKAKNDKIISLEKKSKSLLELQRELEKMSAKNVMLTKQLESNHIEFEKMNTNYKILVNDDVKIRKLIQNYSSENIQSKGTSQLANEILQSKSDDLNALEYRFKTIENKNKELEKQNELLLAQISEQKKLLHNLLNLFT